MIEPNPGNGPLAVGSGFVGASASRRVGIGRRSSRIGWFPTRPFSSGGFGIRTTDRRVDEEPFDE
jgi:hypothetical protein